MKYILNLKVCLSLFFIFSLRLSLIGQDNVLVVEKKIQTNDGGLITFFYCKSNPNINYDNKKDYVWFNDFSGVQETKGGSGGYLLHGKYLQFGNKGNLLMEINFSYGLRNGESKTWDDEGTLVESSKFDMDNLTYSKFKNKEGYFIEWIGEMFKKGAIKNVYSESGNFLLEKSEFIEDFKVIMTIYYEYSNKVQYSFISSMDGTMKYGFYKEYFKNGQLKVYGNYDNTNMTGIWKFYNEFGELVNTEEYRIVKELYKNGTKKLVSCQL